MIWTICKVFIEFARILLLFYVLVCHEACGILAPQPSIEPVPHTLEDDVLTSGLPEKSLQESFNNSFLFFFFFRFSFLLLQSWMQAAADQCIYIWGASLS